MSWKTEETMIYGNYNEGINMPRTIKLEITDDSEMLLNRMKEKGISEKSAIAKALWLLDQADKGNLALVDEQGILKDRIRIR